MLEYFTPKKIFSSDKQHFTSVDNFQRAQDIADTLHCGLVDFLLCSMTKIKEHNRELCCLNPASIMLMWLMLIMMTLTTKLLLLLL